jgi:hypothetical protein
MVPSPTVVPEVSQVASDGADRPPREAAGPAAPGGRRRLGRILGALIIAAALVVAAVFARTSGIPDDQIVDRAADLHSLPQTLPAAPGPPPVVAGLRFPSLAADGWTPVGGRRDALAGRTATTLFYVGGGGRRLAVTVLSGQALPPPPGSRVTRRDGVAVARSTSGDRTVVSWRRAGRTTIMSAVTTDPDELVRLARASTPRPRVRG